MFGRKKKSKMFWSKKIEFFWSKKKNGNVFGRKKSIFFVEKKTIFCRFFFRSCFFNRSIHGMLTVGKEFLARQQLTRRHTSLRIPTGH